MENNKILTLLYTIYMNKIIWILLSFLFLKNSFAQNKIIVQGSYPNLFLQHKVAHGETMYSISKLYNFPAHQLAIINGMTDKDVLSTNKILKITLGKNNFTQDGSNGQNMNVFKNNPMARQMIFNQQQGFMKQQRNNWQQQETQQQFGGAHNVNEAWNSNEHRHKAQNQPMFIDQIDQQDGEDGEIMD